MAGSESSLAEFMNLKLFGRTILVETIKLGYFLGHPLSQCDRSPAPETWENWGRREFEMFGDLHLC